MLHADMFPNYCRDVHRITVEVYIDLVYTKYISGESNPLLLVARN
jgi:hypothetical protein